ncbi:NAD(P)H-binding protein [Nostoc sp. MG11]|uniref:NmrA family NAD(P)-binding protein n=1 Tax=Nostoc sp. MG11 TaxID=2721166 RepID=UPI001865C14A|nr:NAD(P)H-binding protein [Nostoc sp. MG11]
MIVITTPTGQIGQQILDQIIDSGKPIRVIVRDPSRLDPKIRDRVEIVEGSHDDIDVVTKAFAGADCVFWLVPPNPHTDNPTNYYMDFTRPACEAIKSQRVKRVVGVTSLGREFGKNAGLQSAAFAMEDLIESTGVSYRALRMPFFMENLLNQVKMIASQGMFLMPNSSDRQLATVATSDIAEVAVKLLLDDSWSGQGSVPVVSPDELSPNDMAQVMSEVLERPIRFQQVSSEDYKATMMQRGMTEAWVQGMVDMAAAQDEGIYNIDPRTSPSTTPTSFRQWCEDVLKPAVLG